MPAAEPVPRPVGRLPAGLVVVNALVHSGSTDGCVQPVELFMYPGHGQVIVTASAVRACLGHVAAQWSPVASWSLIPR